MDEKIRKRLELEYLKILNKKLELIFNFNPSEDDKKVRLTRERRIIKYDEPIFNSKLEYYGPHDDWSRVVLFSDDKRLASGPDSYDTYPIGRGLFVTSRYKKIKDGHITIHSILDSDGNVIYEDISKIANNNISIGIFCSGFAIIRQGNYLYNVIDSNFRCITTRELFECTRLTNEVFLVKIKNGYNVMDTSGKILFKKSVGRKETIFVNDYFASSREEIVPLVTEYGDYKVKKKLIQPGYTCKKGNDSFETKYLPLRIYGNRYCLCLNNEDRKIYMYDRYTDRYIELENYDSVKYSKDNDFIFTEYSVYFVYNDKLMDISHFYFEHSEQFKKAFSIRNGIDGVLSFEDFRFENMLETEKIIEEELENYKKLKAKVEKEEEAKRLENAEKNSKKKQEEKNQKKKDLLVQLKETIEAIDAEYSDNETIERVRVGNIFVKVNDHLEINPLFINILKYIDLSLFPFTNVKVSNIDFRNTNVQLDPQTVYNKDLSNCNFEGIYIGPFMNFTSVNIIGCKFSDDNNPSTEDYLNSTFKNAIYDKTTTYNGIPLTEIIKNKTK